METPLLRLGLVGCSWFALRAHLPSLLALEEASSLPFRLRLTALCSRTRKSTARAEARVGRPLTKHKQMEAMFSDREVDVVLLVLPIPLVARAVELALRAGKHVISEKPAAQSSEEAIRLLRLQSELTQPTPVWTVVENWAHKPSLLWIRDRLQEGAIGALYGAHCSHQQVVRAKGWDEGWRGGAEQEGAWLVDMGVHWGWIKFDSVAAAATVSLSLRASEAKGSDGAAGCVSLPMLTLLGERGSLCWWGEEDGARIQMNRATEGSSEHAFHDEWITGGVQQAMEDALSHVVRESRRRSTSIGARVLANGRLEWPCRVTCEEAALDLALVDSLLLSSRTARAVEPETMLGRYGLLCSPARPLVDASCSRRSLPLLRVRCLSERDVLSALELARSRGLKLPHEELLKRVTVM
ncbi:MAG: hypothetical protein SGPRY_013553 [Prymnesium sp.]